MDSTAHATDDRAQTHDKEAEMRWKLACALAVAVGGVALYVGEVRATPGSGQVATVLAKSLFDELRINAHTLPADTWQAQLRTHGMSDVYVVDNTFAPGGTSGWHSHPGPSLIFVVKGTVTNYEGGGGSCSVTDYSAGSGFVDEGGDSVHMIRNNGTVPAETIAVQFLPTGATRKIDEPDPGTCAGQ
jgi:quercetin dioxygenase-like cupin family protein